MDLLDIVLDYDCNLKCDYCTITDDMRRRSLSTEQVAGHIAQAAQEGTTALSFTGGEPTIRPDLLGLAGLARRSGFSDIKVQTNGLIFASPGNVERAVEAGVTRVHVSVHGHDGAGPTPYESITRAEEGVHALMLQAIERLVAAPEIRVECDLIVMTSTLPTILAGLRDLHARGVTTFNLWFVSLTDNNSDNVASLPLLAEAIPAVTACLDYGQAEGIEVRSLHLPRCLLPGREDHVAHPGQGLDVQVVTPDATFQLSASRLAGGHKPPRCQDCMWEARCPGLRHDYVARFGDDAIQPVRAPGASP